MRLSALCLSLALASTPLLAKVPAHEADQLRNRLTPLGGERAGNAQGTIPEWRGGQTASPPCHVRGRRYCDPHAGQQPYLVITAENADAWSNQLSAGQMQMLQRHPTYRIPVYPSQRSFANPGAVYEAAHRNALNAMMAPSGEAVREASLAVPFPVTKNGLEMIWNHRLRYRGPGYSRWFSHASVTGTGDINLTRIREDAEFPYTAPDTMEDGVMQRWLQIVLAPERLFGYVNLIYDTLDPASKPQNTWRQVPDPKRILRLRTFGADNPAMLSEDLRFDDQHDGFFGTPGRYTWRLVQKREMFVPYNSYALHGSRGSIRDIIQPAHLKPELTRYELHRVWVVEALLKPSASHRAKRRTFYIDEDSWQILMVDMYDRADRLWRWQETHTMMAYDRATLIPAAEVFYDFDTARYLVMSIDEGDPERIETTFDDNRFTPSGARAQAPH